MKIRSQRDFVSGLLFVVIGAAFAVGATTYTLGSSAKPGPGYFPLLLGLIMAVLGLMVTFKALTIETEDGDPIGPISWKPLLLVLGSVLLFGLLLPRLGMAITVPVLVLVSSLAGDEFHWKGAVITSLLLSVGSWVVFVKGLGLTMPLWPVFITG
jgi:hypothetical protein